MLSVKNKTVRQQHKEHTTLGTGPQKKTESRTVLTLMSSLLALIAVVLEDSISHLDPDHIESYTRHSPKMILVVPVMTQCHRHVLIRRRKCMISVTLGVPFAAAGRYQMIRINIYTSQINGFVVSPNDQSVSTRTDEILRNAAMACGPYQPCCKKKRQT